MYALFKDDKIIAGPFPTQDACAAEAEARGLVKPMPRVDPTILADGVSIRDLDAPVKS